MERGRGQLFRGRGFTLNSVFIVEVQDLLMYIYRQRHDDIYGQAVDIPKLLNIQKVFNSFGTSMRACQIVNGHRRFVGQLVTAKSSSYIFGVV